MKTLNEICVLALKEHVLSGNPVTRLEALVQFGVSNLPAEINRLRERGYIVKTCRVSYLRVIRRINKVATVKPPGNLPLKEIQLTEYRLSL